MHAATGGDADVVNQSLTIYRVGESGWVRGPKLSGTIQPPSGDWLRVMPSGVFRVDARVTVRTDDGATIFISYNGVVDVTPEVFERMRLGEAVTPADLYFCIAPTFETSDPRYDWLNRIQAVGRMSELKLGSHVRYEIFAAR